MYIQIVNFGLKGTSEEEYRAISEAVAPAFANVPGLVSKTWIADPETGTYGGVYVWRTREAMETFRHTDIFRGMLANPRFEDVTVRDFGILEAPTRITRGAADRITV